MGVHDVDKYPKVKELLGIPQDEPIFIIRGKDELAVMAVIHYRNLAAGAQCTRSFLDDLAEVREDFRRFASEHRDKMRRPD